MKLLCQWFLYNVLGWKKEVTVEHPDKYVICLAPHTSNWDFLIGQLYSKAEGLHSNYLMKKEWFFWPLGILFRKMGGIPVYRDRKSSMTEVLATTARNNKKFHLTITPEGTRSYNAEWKKGFYFIAYGANIPILLYALDYKSKLIKCTKSVVPTGNIDVDLPMIKSYYSDIVAKHPENFGV